MKCPPEIADVLIDILTHGLLQARAAGWSGNAARAALEADHIHNLPRLLGEFDSDSLGYYWDAERTAYLARAEQDWSANFQPLWEELCPHIKRAAMDTAAS